MLRFRQSQGKKGRSEKYSTATMHILTREAKWTLKLMKICKASWGKKIIVQLFCLQSQMSANGAIAE